MTIDRRLIDTALLGAYSSISTTRYILYVARNVPPKYNIWYHIGEKTFVLTEGRFLCQTKSVEMNSALVEVA